MSRPFWSKRAAGLSREQAEVVSLNPSDPVPGKVLGRVEEKVPEKRGPGCDRDGRAAEIARLGLRAKLGARVVNASEDRDPERRVNLDADRVVRVLGGRPRDAFVRPREDAVARGIEESPPAGAGERLRGAGEIARIMEKEVEIPHRTKSRVRIVKKRERRALQRDDLDARAAERVDDSIERFEKSIRAGTGEKSFCE